MNQIKIYGFLAAMLMILQTSYSQMGNNTVELDEVILSLPFSQVEAKSVIKVNKINHDVPPPHDHHAPPPQNDLQILFYH